MAGRYFVQARVWLDHHDGPEPSEAEVAQAVANRLGDGAYEFSVDREPTEEEYRRAAEQGTGPLSGAFGLARLVPTETESDLAKRIDEQVDDPASDGTGTEGVPKKGIPYVPNGVE